MGRRRALRNLRALQHRTQTCANRSTLPALTSSQLEFNNVARCLHRLGASETPMINVIEFTDTDRGMDYEVASCIDWRDGLHIDRSR